MALRAKVIDFFRINCLEHAAQARAVREIPIVQGKLSADEMGVVVKMVDAIGIEEACASDQAVDFVTFGEQEFGKIGAVLAGNAGDQCTSRHPVVIIAL